MSSSFCIIFYTITRRPPPVKPHAGQLNATEAAEAYEGALGGFAKKGRNGLAWQ
jgi:hypothetical protein